MIFTVSIGIELQCTGVCVFLVPNLSPLEKYISDYFSISASITIPVYDLCLPFLRSQLVYEWQRYLL